MKILIKKLTFLFVFFATVLASMNVSADLFQQDFKKEYVSIEFPGTPSVEHLSTDDEGDKLEYPIYYASTTKEWDNDDLLLDGAIVNEFSACSPERPNLKAKKEFTNIIKAWKMTPPGKILISKKISKKSNNYYLHLTLNISSLYAKADEQCYSKITYIITPHNLYMVSTNYSASNADKENHQAFLNSLKIITK